MVALVVTVPLAALYLVLEPASGDLAAATYRGELFARAGFTLWNEGWYGGHYLPGYSLLAPALGAVLGERLLLALCAIAAAGLFGLLAQRTFRGTGARVAGASFALGVCAGLLSGRVAYGLGITVGLLALVVLLRGGQPQRWCSPCSTSLASPVAGAFLALAGLAYALGAPDGHVEGGRADWRPRSRGLALAGTALAPILALAVVFPEGGWEMFAPSLFLPALGGVILIALVLPRTGGALAPGTRRMLTLGAWLYALALAGAFVLRTPVGSNAARLGPLLAAPLVAGVLWERRRLVLILLAPVLLYWQLETPVNDFAALAGNPSVNASYYAPLVGKLTELTKGRPLRVEVPLTEAHWESVYLPEHPLIMLARGWERQLDTRYNPLFYRAKLAPAAYRSWLAETPSPTWRCPTCAWTPPAGRRATDRAGASLPGRGVALGTLATVAVRDATPLAQSPAILAGVGPDSFILLARHPGAFTVRVHFTPYWTIERGPASVHPAPGGWTEIYTHRAGVIRVGIDLL